MLTHLYLVLLGRAHQYPRELLVGLGAARFSSLAATRGDHGSARFAACGRGVHVALPTGADRARRGVDGPALARARVAELKAEHLAAVARVAGAEAAIEFAGTEDEHLSLIHI